MSSHMKSIPFLWSIDDMEFQYVVEALVFVPEKVHIKKNAVEAFISHGLGLHCISEIGKKEESLS